MKIYNVINKIDGLGNGDFDYEAVYNSGRTAGYDSGYADAYEECHLDYSKKYFTIEMTSDGGFKFVTGASFDYRINGGEWTENREAEENVYAGDIIEFRGLNEGVPWLFSAVHDLSYFNGTFKAYGNIMSFFYGDDYEDKTEFPSGSTSNCSSMFYKNSGLTDVENLVLPATVLTELCYSGMFRECPNLGTTVRELPATTMTKGCYGYMFAGTNVTGSPELPARNLDAWCYEGMFTECTNFVSAPELPATTLANNCYQGMFAGCTSLTVAPELPATTLAPECYQGMFLECTNLTTAPELPATELENYCYTYMFSGCSSLNYLKCLATDLSAESPTALWTLGVAPNGTFVKHPNVTWPTGTGGIPVGWTVIDAE